MKRILSILLSILMLSTVLFSVPFTVSANSMVDCTEAVYHVSTYNELADAFADSEHNRTIILDKDIETNNSSSQYDIYISGSKTVVFDMNGYDLKVMSTRTDYLFTVRESAKVHFINTASVPSKIFYDVDILPSISNSAIVNLDGSVSSLFNTYNIEYNVGFYDHYDNNFEKDYITSNNAVEINVINIKGIGDLGLLGGKFVNYYEYGCGIYTEKSAECYEMNISGTEFSVGYRALYCMENGMLNIKINDTKMRRRNNDYERPLISYFVDQSATLSAVLGKNKMTNDVAVAKDKDSNTIAADTSLKNITNGLDVVTLGSDQSYMSNLIIPAGHIYVYYENNGFDLIGSHKGELVQGFAPDCTIPGMSQGVKCSVCGFVMEDCDEIPAKGHTPEYIQGIAPGCTTTGLTIGSNCCVCGEVLEKQEEIPATGHTEITVGAKKATYFAKGYSGYKVCSVCDTVISKGKTTKKLVLKTPKSKYTSGKRLFKVKYTKVKDAKGFQVKYKIGKKTKTKTYTTGKTVTKTIKKLKKGTYKVQIRAFVKSGSKKAYSSWTNVKKIKVK